MVSDCLVLVPRPVYDPTLNFFELKCKFVQRIPNSLCVYREYTKRIHDIFRFEEMLGLASEKSGLQPCFLQW